MPLRDWHSSKAQPSVVVPGSAPGPLISEGTIREKRFLRLLTTAVELTSCRHPTSPQRASTFPEETQNSLYARVHVMPLRIDVNSVNSTTTTTITSNRSPQRFSFVSIFLAFRKHLGTTFSCKHTTSRFLPSCLSYATYWCMCRCCVTYWYITIIKFVGVSRLCFYSSAKR